MENNTISSRMHTAIALTGKEKSCTLFRETNRKILQNTILVFSYSGKVVDVIKREQRELLPGAFTIRTISESTNIGNLFESLINQGAPIFLDQEQVTAIIDSHGQVVLPRLKVGGLCGMYSAVFFFKEGDTPCVVVAKTAAHDIQCTVSTLDEAREWTLRDDGVIPDRVILPVA